MSDLPTRLAGICEDCGTTVTLEHSGGIGGAELMWRCPVCLNGMNLLTSPPPSSDAGAGDTTHNPRSK